MRKQEIRFIVTLAKAYRSGLRQELEQGLRFQRDGIVLILQRPNHQLWAERVSTEHGSWT